MQTPFGATEELSCSMIKRLTEHIVSHESTYTSFTKIRKSFRTGDIDG